MESLLRESTGRHWYPKAIQIYKSNLKLPRGVFYKNQIESNFAYNMQYLEYL